MIKSTVKFRIADYSSCEDNSVKFLVEELVHIMRHNITRLKILFLPKRSVIMSIVTNSS